MGAGLLSEMVEFGPCEMDLGVADWFCEVPCCPGGWSGWGERVGGEVFWGWLGVRGVGDHDGWVGWVGGFPPVVAVEGEIAGFGY